MKRKILALCVVVAMLTVAIVGGTMAYFTDTDQAVNVMTMGNVKIEQIEQERDANGNLVEFKQGKELLPATADPGTYIGLNGEKVTSHSSAYKFLAKADLTDVPNTIDKIITVKNTGKSDAYVRTLIAFEVVESFAEIRGTGTEVMIGLMRNDVSNPDNDDATLGNSDWRWNWIPTPIEIDGQKFVVAEVVHEAVLKPNVETIPSLLQIYMKSYADQTYAAGLGDTYDVIALTQAIQAAGFGSAKTALDEGFGVADAANVATWFGGEEFTIPTLIDTAEELKAVLTSAGAANAGNSYIAITSDLDLTGETWTPIYVNGYHGADVITIDGGGNTIKGLTAPLFAGGFAGGSGIVIKDLTIADSNIVSTNTIGSGAFIDSVDSMAVITLENCHLVNSTVTGGAGSRTGGLIGWTAGYSNVNDGPVKTYVNIKKCSVIDSTITCDGSVGGIYGHAGNNDWTYSTIENCTVKGCTLNSTDDGEWRVGVVVGTANVGEVTIKNITESGNTLTQTGKTAPAHSNLYGRFVPGNTGKLTIDGVAIQ